LLSSIRAMELPSNENDFILHSKVKYKSTSDGTEITERGELRLHGGRLDYISKESRYIDLDEILFFETSRSTTLQLTFSNERVSFTFMDRIGPLPWFDAIKRLKEC